MVWTMFCADYRDPQLQASANAECVRAIRVDMENIRAPVTELPDQPPHGRWAVGAPQISGRVFRRVTAVNEVEPRVLEEAAKRRIWRHEGDEMVRSTFPRS